MLTVDLTNCDNEPIHIPGKIQSHGFLIVLNKSLKIICCSENLSQFLPVYANDLLNKSVRVLDNYHQKKNQPEYIFQLFHSDTNKKSLETSNPYPININGQSFNLIICPSPEFYLLEFEPEIVNLKPELYSQVSKSMSRILGNTELSQLLTKAAEEIRKIIDYDRVMIYKFHNDGHGEVVAEDKMNDLAPFLGLHYPASDIPKQAKELYKINLVRLIADVNAKPSDLVQAHGTADMAIDLTHSILRSVSPVHIQYLKNMGVVSSFSISIIHQGELWGLVACHNYSPRFINYKQREAASLIGKVLSSTLSFQQQEENQLLRHALQVSTETLAKQLSQDNSIDKALLGHEVTLLNAVRASGAVLAIDKKVYTCGITPPGDFLDQLIEWLNKNRQEQVIITNNLSVEFKPARDYREACSGLLAIRLFKDLNDYLIWMRPEVIHSVNWAGNPEKPVEFDHGNFQISPRKSFEKWSQTVINTSLVWENEDRNSALLLKEEVSSSIIKKAAETRQLNQKLQEAYDTLDTFSYTISHDLKNPLTSISAYSQILNEDPTLEPKNRPLVSGILNSVQKMELMIKNILHHSQIGQFNIRRVSINMDTLLKDIKQELLIADQNKKTEIIIKNTPAIWAEEIMAMQVFSNILSNAIKYSGKGPYPQIVIEGKEIASGTEYSIFDNGIGIKQADQGRIFELFTRSSEVQDYEGLGVGLSIVKRIMDRHEGKIWVESDGKSGSTFYIFFKKQGDQIT